MAQFNNSAEREQEVAIWQEAFGDSEEYIRFFLDNHRSYHIIFEKVNGEIASMLFLIDGKLVSQGEERKAFYLFAACTLQKYRGNGLMKKLLGRAESFSKEQGADYIALVPAEKSLFDYYGRFGYKTAFYIKKQSSEQPLQVSHAEFVWCAEHLEYIIAQSRRFDAEVCKISGNLFEVFDGGYIKAPAENIESGSEYGMLLALNQKAAEKMPQNAYIGLTLE